MIRCEGPEARTCGQSRVDEQKPRRRGPRGGGKRSQGFVGQGEDFGFDLYKCSVRLDVLAPFHSWEN